MNLDQVNKWLVLFLNLAVVAGILLVAVQIHENTVATRLQTASAFKAQLASGELACMGDTFADAFATAALRPSELTQAQVMQIWCYISNQLDATAAVWVAYREGRVSPDEWNAYKADCVVYLGYGVDRIIWDQAKATVDPLMAKEIDDALPLANGSGLPVFQTIVNNVKNASASRPNDAGPEMDGSREN
jgi:hypothetical protein